MDDSDADSSSKPKFNSTALGPDERSSSSDDGAKSTGQRALRLSPIPKHRTAAEFMDTSSKLLTEQNFGTTGGGNPFLTVSRRQMKERDDEEEEMLSSLTRSKLKTREGDQDDEKMAAYKVPVINKYEQPKSNRSHITNPFDSDLMESLSTTTYSPSLFDFSKRSEGEETPEKSFRWSIGQMADLHPANIDETEPMRRTPDPEEEAQIHSAIDKFWSSQKYIIPSPQVLKSGSLASPSPPRKKKQFVYHESPLTRRVTESQQSVEVQTMFTFPPNLDLVGLLGNCFQYEEGEVPIFEANLSLDTLRRKLFFNSSSSQTTKKSESDSSAGMHDDDCANESGPFGDDRPKWYHSDEEREMPPAKRLSFDDITDSEEEAEISSLLISPNISPIKSQKN